VGPTESVGPIDPLPFCLRDPSKALPSKTLPLAGRDGTLRWILRVRQALQWGHTTRTTMTSGRRDPLFASSVQQEGGGGLTVNNRSRPKAAEDVCEGQGSLA
jgi:hypothetical protein